MSFAEKWREDFVAKATQLGFKNVSFVLHPGCPARILCDGTKDGEMSAEDQKRVYKAMNKKGR